MCMNVCLCASMCTKFLLTCHCTHIWCHWTNMTATLWIWVTQLLWYMDIYGHCCMCMPTGICNIYFTCYYQVCASNKYASWRSYIQISLCAHDTAISVSIHHIISLQSTMWQEALVYMYFTLLAYASEQICLPHCIYICVPLYHHCSLHNFTSKFKTTNCNYLALPYMCQQQIWSLKCYIYGTCLIIWCAWMGDTYQYICHIWSCSHQWCSQVHCTQMMMPTKMIMMPQPKCIDVNWPLGKSAKKNIWKQWGFLQKPCKNTRFFTKKTLKPLQAFSKNYVKLLVEILQISVHISTREL